MGVKGKADAAASAAKAFLSSRLLWILLVLGLLWVGARRAQDSLARDPRFLAIPAGLDARGPAWGGDEVLAPVREALRRLGPLNLFDRGFEAKVRAALAAVPGVACVKDVRRHWPNRYGISFRLYRPVAVVAWRGKEIPVTAKGVALPYEPYARASDGLFRIVGVAESPPAAGREWRSEALRDGLATLRQLAPNLDRIHPLLLGTIDVSHARDPRKGVALGGDAQVTVLWGRPRAVIGENTVEKKLGLLEIAASNVRAVAGRIVDVRFDTLFLRQSAE
ncbi:MAG TPA: hypothetical protein VFY93_14240 [Planctomycetota bacterium]|nr:hypothetical protein [Planctomycetota bacterium]